MKKIRNLKFVIRNYQRGMSYVELIVVLSIFATMSSIVVFNYDIFQAKIDIKNLVSDIAFKIVEAQKSSVSGKFPPTAQQSQLSSLGTISTWKPSYGIYIDLATDPKSFTYFTDLDQGDDYDISTCPGSLECLEKISITKGNIISRLDVFYTSAPTVAVSVSNVTILFKRPNSEAIINSSSGFTFPVSHFQITVTSPKSVSSVIKVYRSGRIQIN